ncbi:MAG TPA: DNA polymerase III subunit gamma/tau, partial [Acidimicrobiales bacterium]|nr:DNA polymerase III subunit gamma/tau [Acidimicrobiales bacterium]
MPDTSDDAPYQSLYRRFRPSTFGEVRGQDHVVLALRNAVRDGRVAHAYLFSGPRGTGKTSTARILAKALNCTDLHDGEPCGACASCVEIAKGTSLDVHELDAASTNGVEAMRDLVARAALGTPGRQKVYIVDEVHMLSTPASNALLKTLEEPPAHVIFVLATTDPQKVLPTIRSRTQHFEFRLLGPETLGDLLIEVRRQAHLDVPDEALDLAVRRGRGSARDALSVLDQVVASDSVDDDLPELDEVVEALAERDVGRALVAVAHLASAGYSPPQLAGDLVDHLRQGFLTLVAPDLVAVSGTEQEALSSQAERVGLATLVRAMEVLGEAQVSMRDAPDPRVTLEVALVRLAHPEADDSPEALLVRIERLEASGRATPLPPLPEAPPPVDTRPVAADDSGDPPALATRKTVGAVRRQSAPPPVDAAPSSPAPSPAVTPPVVDGDVAGSAPFPSRDQLVQAWGDHVIGGLRPKAKALFQAGRFVGVEDDKAVFGLPNEIHRTRCEEVRGEIEAALSGHFGRQVGLVLIVDSGTPAGGSDPVASPSAVAGSPSASPPGPPDAGAPPPRSSTPF